MVLGYLTECQMFSPLIQEALGKIVLECIMTTKYEVKYILFQQMDVKVMNSWMNILLKNNICTTTMLAVSLLFSNCKDLNSYINRFLALL